MPALDAIRVSAILLVLGRHMPPPPESVQGPVRWFLDRWFDGGWIGVDLFFVLSGFLVGGLLFAESQSTGRIRILRFYARRGFKIYPAFYLFLALTLIVTRRLHEASAPGAWLSELFFLQSYFRGVWAHTWSLAVEEHFYLALPLMLVAVKISGRATAEDANKIVLLTSLSAIACLSLRLIASADSPVFDKQVHLFPTHLRIDALFSGVLIAYIWRFHPERILRFHPVRFVLLAAGILCLVPPFLFPLENWAIHTVGMTTNYIGAAAILVAALLCRSTPRLIRLLGWLGPQTYSIYLWHEFMRWRVERSGFASVYAVGVAAYMVGSVLIGWSMAILIEQPALRIRERLFPRTIAAA